MCRSLKDMYAIQRSKGYIMIIKLFTMWFVLVINDLQYEVFIYSSLKYTMKRKSLLPHLEITRL